MTGWSRYCRFVFFYVLRVYGTRTEHKSHDIEELSESGNSMENSSRMKHVGMNVCFGLLGLNYSADY